MKPKYIKYERKQLTVDREGKKLQEIFDKLITGGYEIIYYDEQKYDMFSVTVIMVVGKLREE
jgi:hypothetical protein